MNELRTENSVESHSEIDLQTFKNEHHDMLNQAVLAQSQADATFFKSLLKKVKSSLETAAKEKFDEIKDTATE